MKSNSNAFSTQEKKFLRKLHDTARLVRDLDGKVAILTHYDTDGLAAGGAFLRYFALNNNPFVIRATTKLDDNILADFFNLSADHYIMLDLGSDLDRVIPIWMDRGSHGDLLIIDHHKIVKYNEYVENFTFVNPEYYDIDGGTTACTAIMSALITYYATKEEDKYLLELGIVGGYGDMQLQNNISAINQYFVNKAIKNNVVEYVKDFIFFLNRKMPLFRALTWMFIPYIPKFSGRDDVGINILEKVGIPIEKEERYTTIDDINEKQKEEILSVILEYLSSLGVSINVKDLIRESYELKLEDDDILSTAEGFSSILSALGRMEKESLGLLLASGSRGEILDEAKRILDERRKLINRYLEEALRRIRIYGDKIAIIDFRGFDFNPRFTGSISTILSKSITLSDKVVVVLGEEEGKIKVSARAPKTLVKQGFDLSVIMRNLSKKVGGVGGGHNVAAGASLNKTENIRDILVTELMEALPRG